jgi:membrane-associated protease RseP (regulator of RpoE activity)
VCFLLAALGTGSAQAAEHGALGVQLDNQFAGAADGVAVTGVISGSPAAQAGIQPGDRLIAINGQPLSDYRDVLRIVGGQSPDAQLSLVVARGPRTTTQSIHLEPSQQVFPQQEIGRPRATVPSAPMPVAPMPVAPMRVAPMRVAPGGRPVWLAPNNGWVFPGANRWRTHPRDDLMTSLYNSDF